MKKVLCLLLVITLAMSTACFAPSLREIEQDIEDIGTRLADLGKNDDTPAKEEKPTPSPKPPDKSNDTKSVEKSVLSVNKARALAQAWLDKHPVEDGPNKLDDMFFEYTHNGEVYYQFFLTTMQMYWFNILVHMETGDMLLLLIEDGMDGGDYIEPLDEWYNNAFGNNYIGSGIDSLWAALLDAEHYGIVVGLYIYWENGTHTIFFNDYFDGWYIISRESGDTNPVSPEFLLKGSAIEIHFPTTTRVYYLYDDYTGVFGDESFVWFFEVP